MSPGIAQITANPPEVTPSKRWRPTPSRYGLFGRDWGGCKHKTSTLGAVRIRPGTAADLRIPSVTVGCSPKVPEIPRRPGHCFVGTGPHPPPGRPVTAS